MAQRHVIREAIAIVLKEQGRTIGIHSTIRSDGAKPAYVTRVLDRVRQVGDPHNSHCFRRYARGRSTFGHLCRSWYGPAVSFDELHLADPRAVLTLKGGRRQRGGQRTVIGRG